MTQITCAKWDSLLIAGASDADGPPAEVGEAGKLFPCLLIGHGDILVLRWKGPKVQVMKSRRWWDEQLHCI